VTVYMPVKWGAQGEEFVAMCSGSRRLIFRSACRYSEHNIHEAPRAVGAAEGREPQEGNSHG
jgi:hypothetical protein